MDVAISIIAFRGKGDGSLEGTLMTCENTSDFPKCPFFDRTEPHFLVASFFYTTFASDFKNCWSIVGQLLTDKKRFLDHFGTFWTKRKILIILVIFDIFMRLDIQLLTAAVLSLGGLVLLFCGVYIEPLGQIHESLLIGFGEVATFAGALFGIDYVYKKKR